MGEHGLYIGCKVIKAKPMNELRFINEIRNEDVPQNREDRAGYLIGYPGGYKSWSPKEVFETVYRPMKVSEVQLINE